MRGRRLLTKAACAIVVAFIGAPCVALELNQEARQLVERLVLDRATTVAMLQRRANAREDDMLRQLRERDSALRRERGTRRRIESALLLVQQQRAALIAEIAARDRSFQMEVAVYREQVSSIASSSDSRKVSALRAYADGDRQGGFDALLELQRAETAAVAAGWRELGALALDRYDRGEATAESVAALFREAQRIDPSNFDGWVVLSRLELMRGDVDSAAVAARRAQSLASDSWQRALAAAEVSQALAQSGRLTEASRAASDTVRAMRDVADTYPSDRASRRNLVAALLQLGDLQLRSADPQVAQQSVEEAVALGDALLGEMPEDILALEHRATAFAQRGDIALAREDASGASAAFDELYALSERLARLEPGSRRRLRNVSIALDKRGLVRMSASPLDARKDFELALQMRRRLLAVDANNLQALIDVTFSARRVGLSWAATQQRGDVDRALEFVEESIRVGEQAAKLAPHSIDVKLELALSHLQLGFVRSAQGQEAQARDEFARAIRYWDDVSTVTALSAAHQRLRAAAEVRSR
jgi:tetratricopeptide (TPR) repeat protein